MRALLFKVIIFLLVIFFCEVIGYWAMWVNSRQFDFLSNKNYFAIRAMLMGNPNPELFPRYLSVPYLGYIPYPGYKKYGVVQHNKDGYRGDWVPLKKNKNLRILCLGGSTTYGFGVKLPTQTYPHQLKLLLDSAINCNKTLKENYTGVEIINAGVEDANSADELAYYCYKFRYYKPDIVIVHSGINDAFLLSNYSNNLQLDYTSYRRINLHLEKAPPPLKFLFHSYFFSYITIRLFYHDFVSNQQNELYHQMKQTFCKWTDDEARLKALKMDLEFYPFYHNANALFSEITKDSIALIVMPCALSNSTPKSTYTMYTLYNANILQALAQKWNATYVPFSFESIDSDCWIDDCHLNAIGEQQKAILLSQYVLNVISATEYNPKKKFNK
jgi:lysophospholipase L1-like esterase